MSPSDPVIPASAEVLTLTPADRSAVYLLAVDPEAPQMAALLAPRRLNGETGATLAALLGLPPEAEDELELVNPADLEGVGLSGYLTEGLGLDPEEVTPDRPRLDAVTAPVVLLRGRLTGLEDRVLPLPRGLSLLGRYDADYTPIGLGQIPTRTATAGTLPPPQGPLPGPFRLSRPWQITLILTGIVALGLLLWFALALI
ncbi:hypothetical protein KUV28_13940 [Ferrimonas balearica]|nr:hypothetical protein [Ferrimonas balearica]